MQQIVYFIIKYKYFLLFLLLEIIALTLTVNSHSYHKSKFVNSANFLTGGIYKRINAFQEYSNLGTYNEQLLEENTRLKNILSQKEKNSDPVFTDILDTVKYDQKYKYTNAKVINNQYNRSYNFLTIDKGAKVGIKADQGVINSKGIIGIINSTSANYATVLSILNQNSKINARLLNSFHFGTLEWNGKDYNTLQLVDLPIQANIKKGDTIITGGKSTIFPEGIPIGTVNEFSVENNSYNNIDIRLFNDMSAIGPVYIITNFDKEEILNLEQNVQHE